MIRRPPRSTLSSSSAASDVYKRQIKTAPTTSFLVDGIDDPPSNRLFHGLSVSEGCAQSVRKWWLSAPLPVLCIHERTLPAPARIGRSTGPRRRSSRRRPGLISGRGEGSGRILPAPADSRRIHRGWGFPPARSAQGSGGRGGLARCPPRRRTPPGRPP